MAYGTGGTTTGYNTHVAGTGGYCKVTQESETPFEGYQNIKEINICKLPSETLENVVEISNWTQPTLTANGTLGGDSFACDQIASHTSSTLAFRCFNGDVSSSGETNRWQVNSVNTSSWYWVSWYNPQPLNITKLIITNAEENYCVKNYIIQGSDNGSTWVDIVSGTNTNTNGLSQWTINMSNNEKAYKYHRIYCQPNTTMSLQIAEIGITATQKKIIDKQIKYYGII